MESHIFANIPSEYESMKSCIQNKIISNIYSKLSFLYLSSDLVNKYDLNNEEKILKSPLFHFFQSNKLIAYQIHDPSEKLNYLTLFDDFYDNKAYFKSLPQYITVVICAESECLIIESILKQTMYKILNETKSILINVSKNSQDGFLISEIKNFYNEIRSKITINDFFQLTFKPIAAFFIRRYFYPSYYFKDTSFFTFDQKYRTFEIESKKSISNLLLLNNENKFDEGFATFFSKSFFEDFKKSCFEDDDQINLQKFSKSDFIFLRTINSNEIFLFHLAIHIKSLYIFMIKELKNENGNSKGFENEKFFCEHIRHRCVTRFYGFYYETNSIKGFVYEFMSNGTLNNFILNENTKINDLFKFMTICRIFQGLNHLHSNYIIHRDLKPSNIFLDHDFLPYISDFDASRYLLNESNFTNDYGSSLYTSPEQEKGEIISTSTDIYSFGLIIYFLFEKKHLFNVINKSNDILIKLDTSKNIQDIFIGCLKYDKDQRMTNNEIIKKLYNDVYSFEYLERFLFKNFDPFYNQELVNYFYENFCFVYRFDKNIAQLNYSISYTSQYIALKLVKENEGFLDFLFHLACTYIINQIIEHDFNKAIMYLKMVAERDHIPSILYLETIGIFDFSSPDNKSKFVNYLISAARRKDSNSLIQLGNLYFKGDSVQKNDEKAIQCYKEAAKLGNQKAFLCLGNFYLTDYHTDYQKAIYYLNLAGQQGNSDALLNLGDIYNEGKGVNIDFKQAFQYYNLSAAQNNPFALNRIGDLYYKGKGVEKNNSLAIEYYTQSLKVDYLDQFKNINVPQQQMFYIKQDADYLYQKFKAETFFKLGRIYLDFDIKKSIENFALSAKLNNDKAQFNLGIIYLKHTFGVNNYQKAKHYFELSAQNNNSMALFQLGNIYFFRLGVDENDNYQKALYYYNYASKLGNSDANVFLGYLYLDGIIVEQKHQIAFNYFKMAEKQGNPNAYSALGYLCLNGIIEKNFSKAHYYYDKLVKLNNSNGFLGLGYIYFYGLGVEKDDEKAIQYYEYSAKMGNSEAQYFLGTLYLSRFLDRSIYSRAISYLLCAANNQNPNAYFQLGQIFCYGIGCEINYKLALEYYEKAAQMNHLKSIYILAKMYQEGFGSSVNISEAIKWFKKCIEIEDLRVEKYLLKDKSLITSIRSSIYFYMSMNDLGLIYITEPKFENKNFGLYYIKEAGLNEFVFAQNNYGLVLKYYIKDENKSFSMFNKASESNFSLSDFNIGHFYEEKGIIDESIQFYLKASQHEDVPCCFRNTNIYDERLLISKTFIICLANLKLVVYYLVHSKYNDARNYFIRSLSKIISFTKGRIYQFIYDKNKGINVFSFLRKFIIECPLFNLKNQPNIDFDKYEDKSNNNHFHYPELNIKEKNKISNINKKIFSSEENNDGIIDDPGELFDFIIHNNFYASQFIQKITEIVRIMDEILEKPPYLILFGRIFINNQEKTVKLSKEKDLNNIFYEGFGINL